MRKAIAVVTVALLGAAALYAGQAMREDSRPAAQRWQAVTGTVQAAPEGRSFVILSQRDGRFTVNARNATIRQLGRVVNFDAVKPGQVVTAFGTRTAGQITAEEVCICPTTPEPGRVAGFRNTNLGITGTVTAIASGRKLTVQSRRDGLFTVDASRAQVRRYGDPAAFDEITPGLVIRAWGASTGTRQIRADEVCICPARLPSQGTAVEEPTK
ncbi:MAG TPA: hypothetical protein PLU39_00400 [Armatimonadota bacterium]|jgi:hypothetical protein|nr:hypothetical protein [Armatimonadota bacterium]HOM80728.1 hypothetical protein [Armatimonadota bacterium]HPO71573.1 hypothetical protein [Armatimonadota bacterium]HPT96307.1 hypothetical protein [Armatimonadota bacterium]